MLLWGAAMGETEVYTMHWHGACWLHDGPVNVHGNPPHRKKGHDDPAVQQQRQVQQGLTAPNPNPTPNCDMYTLKSSDYTN